MPSFARLTAEQATQLSRVPTSTDGFTTYAPCEVRLASGEVRDRVYLVEAHDYFAGRGDWPDDGPAEVVRIQDIIGITSSPTRLRADLADEVYREGESGMGYTIFTVVMRDGARLPFSVANAVDFPSWPPGTNPEDAVGVLPHEGRAALAAQGAGRRRHSAPHFWCLYER